MLESFRFLLTRFELLALAPATLPQNEHVGALLRDRFGSAFRHAVCPFSRGQCRTGCAIPRQCAYARLFETTRDAVGPSDLTGKDVYRPYVLEPPIQGKIHYRAGETLAFNLVLVGEGVDYLGYFVAAFEEMGRYGLGVERSSWTLARVTALDTPDATSGLVLYDGERACFTADPAPKDFIAIASESQRLSPEQVSLDLVTPLRLEDHGELVRGITMSILVRALLRRISRLSQLWCGETLDLDFRGLIQQWCDEITCTSRGLHWEDWERDSMRQRRHLKVGGLRGKILLEGNLSDILPFLKLGEYLHIGKQTVFGLGKYQLDGTGQAQMVSMVLDHEA